MRSRDEITWPRHYKLILRIFSKLNFDIVDKGLEVPKVFLEKSFEVELSDISDTLMATLVLSLFETNNTTEE